jgi:hypothetical protein
VIARIATNYLTQSTGRPTDYEAAKRNAYHDQCIAIIDLTDSRISWQDREIIEGARRRLYDFKSRNGQRS